MIIYRLALSAGILLLTSCAAPQTITFNEFAERFEKQAIPERVRFNFQDACNEQGQCLVKQERIDQAAKAITRLNDTIESLVKSNNSKVDAIIHSEYANMKLRESIHHLERSNSMSRIGSIAKQLVVTGACAALLGFK